MASGSKADRKEREGLQVAVPDTSPEVVPPEPSLIYSPRSPSNDKEAHRYDEYRYYDNGEAGDEENAIQPRRLCGFKRRTAFPSIILAILIVIAVVLAATLSTQLNTKSRNKR